MSECEELNTLKEKLDELKETVAEMTDVISSLLTVVTEVEERSNDLESDKKDAEEKAQALEKDKENSEDIKDTVRELINAAEYWDYGLKRWRTLETKQDLINYLRKEVCEVAHKRLLETEIDYVQGSLFCQE